jgi:dolichol-phosphate mannosyltransferase
VSEILETQVIGVRGSRDPSQPRVVAVIPAYRAARTLCRVVDRVRAVVDAVVVVDDCCPERSGATLVADSRTRIVVHERNRGVGGATKTGIEQALAWGAEYIVKIDADDQMDPSFVPQMIDALERYAEIDLVKGNRFADPATLRTMPVARLIGNVGVTLLVKFSSGYWTIVDPSNGFIALRATAISAEDLRGLAERYFFEIDLLCTLGLQRRVIAELEMPAIYPEDSRSSLSIPNVMFSFRRSSSRGTYGACSSTISSSSSMSVRSARSPGSRSCCSRSRSAATNGPSPSRPESRDRPERSSWRCFHS